MLFGTIEEVYTQAMNINTGQSDDNLDVDDDEEVYAGAGPMARRRRKKKRRSGSLSRVLSATVKGIQKAMNRSQVNTPGPSLQRGRGEDSYHCTPLPASAHKSSRGFTSPRLPAKRKAHAEHELSPKSKTRRALLEATFTPKARSRSFSVKKFKTSSISKGSKKTNQIELQPLSFSPLPSKLSFQNVATPGTPMSVDLPAASSPR